MWTEQTVETLKKFAFEGKSASWIAVALGAPSRNAVIGKANRIGIKLNGGTGPRPSKRAPAEPPAEIPWGRSRSPRTKARRARKGDDAPRSPGDRRTPARIAAPRSLAREKMRADRRVYADGRGRRDAADRACGDRRGRVPMAARRSRPRTTSPIAVFRSSRGHAYCAGHCRLAYRPPNPKAVNDGSRKRRVGRREERNRSPTRIRRPSASRPRPER